MKITDTQFAQLWGEALTTADRDVFISDWATSSLFLDPEDEGGIPADLIEWLAQIWEVAHMSVAEIRKGQGLTQAQFAERFCLSRRTLEGWESRGSCPDYVRLMMAELLGLIKR